jgi:hypothetical protein
LGAAERIGFATILLDVVARLDARDDLLRNSPLGWACRWGRVELVTLCYTVAGYSRRTWLQTATAYLPAALIAVFRRE